MIMIMTRYLFILAAQCLPFGVFSTIEWQIRLKGSGGWSLVKVKVMVNVRMVVLIPVEKKNRN